MEEMKYLTVGGVTYQVTDPTAVHSELEQPEWGKKSTTEAKTWRGSANPEDPLFPDEVVISITSDEYSRLLGCESVFVTVLPWDGDAYRGDICDFGYVEDYEVMTAYYPNCDVIIEATFEDTAYTKIPKAYLETGGGSGGVVVGWVTFDMDNNGIGVSHTPAEIASNLRNGIPMMFVYRRVEMGAENFSIKFPELETIDGDVVTIGGISGSDSDWQNPWE